jgi:type I restriction enzyme S subunit
MRFERYECYKDSGLEWLGEIPCEWGVKRVKDIGSVKGRVGWKALKASEYVDKSDYIFIATPNIKYKDIDFKNVNYLTQERYEESPEIMLKIDDIVLTKDGSTLGTVNIVSYLPSKTTVNSSIAVLRFKTANSKFMFYQIKSEYIQNIVKLKKDGAGVPHLFQKDINNFNVIFTPLKTQTKLATYLDTKTKKIDKEIALLEQKIEKYRELKQTLINETFLRGLDRGVEVKDSGIEWIGEIPKGWELTKFKNLNNTFFTGTTPDSKNNEYYNGNINWITISDIKGKFVKNGKKYLSQNFLNKYPQKFTKKGDLIFTFKLSIGKVAFASNDFITNEAIITIQKNKDCNLQYLYYSMPIFITKNSIQNIYGANLLNQDLIKNAKILNIPMTEQIQIANYLDEKTQKIDNITQTISKKIELLKEFRKTLINDVVTGRVKV